MKIGIVGPIFVNVKIEIDGEFDPLGSNTGRATTSYSSEAFEFAKALSDEYEVRFFTSLDTQAAPYIKRLMDQYHINYDNVVYERHGLGFNINFVGNQLDSYISSGTAHEATVEAFDPSGLDAVVVYDIDFPIIEECRRNNIPVFWLLSDEEYAELDPDDIVTQFVEDNNIPHITPESYSKLLKEVFVS